MVKNSDGFSKCLKGGVYTLYTYAEVSLKLTSRNDFIKMIPLITMVIFSRNVPTIEDQGIQIIII